MSGRAREPGRSWHAATALLLCMTLQACASLGGAGPSDAPQGPTSTFQGDTAAPAAAVKTVQSQGTAPGTTPAVSGLQDTTAQGGTIGPGPRTGLDSLNPEGTIAFGQPEARQDLWQRIREGMTLPALQDEALVDSSIQWYAARPDYVKRMTERGSRYLFHIVEEVQRRGLPTELALLPFIESAFNPQALSRAKASGMWQFMPATGKGFDLKQNVFRDDRRDVLASTRAALDYLTRLHAQFGHWHLALAAYNWGEGNVQRAIQRNQRAGLATDYESLRMPDETRRYVPKLLAVKHIVMQPQAHGLSLPPLENHPYFLSVPIERDIDVALAARLAGLSTEEFSSLNPQHHKPVILAAGTPHILLPYDNAERFLIQLDGHKGVLASWTAWVAPRTLGVAEAARLSGMKEDELRSVNLIPRGMLIRQGSTLLVPRSARHSADVSEQLADNGSISLQREQVAKAKAKNNPAVQAKASAGKTTVAKAAPGKPAPRTAAAGSTSSTAAKPAPKAQTKVATNEAPVRR